MKLAPTFFQKSGPLQRGGPSKKDISRGVFHECFHQLLSPGRRPPGSGGPAAVRGAVGRDWCGPEPAALSGQAAGGHSHRLHRRHRRRIQQPVRCRLLHCNPGGLPAGGAGGRRGTPLRPRPHGVSGRAGGVHAHPAGGGGAGQVLPGEDPPPGAGGLLRPVGGDSGCLRRGEAVDVLLQPGAVQSHPVRRPVRHRRRLPVRRGGHHHPAAGPAGRALLPPPLDGWLGLAVALFILRAGWGRPRTPSTPCWAGPWTGRWPPT